MAKRLCVFLLFVSLQTVFCQFDLLSQINKKKEGRFLGLDSVFDVEQQVRKTIHDVVAPHLKHIGIVVQDKTPADASAAQSQKYQEPSISPTLPSFIDDTVTRAGASSKLITNTCETADHRLGTCISIYECQSFLEIIQESREKATENLKKQHCGRYEKEKKICCPNPTQELLTNKLTVPSLPDAPVCGLTNASFDRIVGGVDAKLNDFPWMALLGLKNYRGTEWVCGGSLISSLHVLTAAHCVHRFEKALYVVRLGELDIANNDDGAHPIDVLIKHMIKHEQYDEHLHTSDIAILTLENEVKFTDSIRPICLPKTEDLRNENFEDYNPITAGWGHTKHKGNPSTHLKMLQLPVISNDECKQLISEKAGNRIVVIDERIICAGHLAGGKDACQGDSGGPLMQPWSTSGFDSYFYLIGVVSLGIGCANVESPGVYTRVTHFLPWIEEKVLTA